MEESRYEKLHSPSLVLTANQIAEMAIAEEQRSGKAILYMTAWDIAAALGIDVQQIRQALRLSYTAEFQDEYGFGFIAPGSGRAGDRYGYLLQHGTSSGASEEEDALEYQDRWALDHLHGIQSHYTRLAVAYGRKTRLGKATQRRANAVQVAADAIESFIEQ